ncbi:complement C1q-like protein 4 [Perca flavescens]|uniref:complement C1q-like protein 4 n=1 Tax=Perca flavescens TaxID=8167 RepID=UPI00106E28FC|nr:complement C1q-like protein 4 [Perca flavescens]
MSSKRFATEEVSAQIFDGNSDVEEEISESEDLSETENNAIDEEDEEDSEDQSVRQVAFSASLVNTSYSVVGPSATDITLIFKFVVTNIGNAYNSTTGVFTAPVRGAYNFEWTVGANGGTSGAVLVKNSANVFLAYEQVAGFMSSSKAVALFLEVGDVVFVRVFVNSVVFDNLNHHTTFSGHLLFPM